MVWEITCRTVLCAGRRDSFDGSGGAGRGAKDWTERGIAGDRGDWRWLVQRQRHDHEQRERGDDWLANRQETRSSRKSSSSNERPGELQHLQQQQPPRTF
nr:hypothetical protein CFP56_50943 [Quercus suber]